MSPRSIRPLAAQLKAVGVSALFLLLAACASAPTPPPEAAGVGLPTVVRVQYVQECVNLNGRAFALLYQCSCAVDMLATKFNAEDFDEAATFAKYTTLAGERGGEFRDGERARELAGRFRREQTAAYKACGVKPVAPPR